MTERRTIVVAADSTRLDAAVAQAIQIIRAGGLVAFPTETVYGLGANALDASAVQGIFNAKGRPTHNPLIVHVSDEIMLKRVVGAWPERARALAARFWPGALTLIVPKGQELPEQVTAGGPTVAVRMPSHPVALALIRAAGVPLAAPSANRSGSVSPTSAQHVLVGLAGRIDMILDGGPTVNGIESTVLDLTTEPPTLLRPGPISIAQLEEIVGPIARSSGEPPSGALRSPGMLSRHYAPRARLELCGSANALAQRYAFLGGGSDEIGVLALGAHVNDCQHVVHMPQDAVSYAAGLYAALHELDSLPRIGRILVEMPPDTEEWLAIRDRLRRAAS